MKNNVPWYLINPKDQTELILIPGGWFWMGSADDDPDADDDEKPRHLHYVAPFYFSLACITVEQFGRFVKETGYKGGDYPKTGDGWDERWGYWKKDPPNHPVRYINYHDANAYCNWAELRLPTEAEWELVARGYEGLKYPWGDDWQGGRQVCWREQKGPKGETAPVFDHPGGVSPFGSFQQSGNLRQWCQDPWDSNVYQRYAKGDFNMPEDSLQRCLRGASWLNVDPKHFRSAFRINGKPEVRDGFSGLRASRTVTF